MVIVLIGALIYYNVVDRDPPNPTQTTVLSPTGISEGKNVGELCYSYDLRIYGQDASISVENTRGKITIINFWGTWCTPCVAELLNEFPLIAEEYKDQVTIITVHSYEEYSVDVPAYIAANFPDSSYIFCKDGEGNAYCTMLGGGQAWPHTLILDEDGVIREVIPRATNYDELKTAIEKILAD